MAILMYCRPIEEQPVLPPGYRFAPTDQELVSHYLMKKASSSLDEPKIIDEINARELYRTHPKSLEAFSDGEKHWYYFIPVDENFDGGINSNRMVEEGTGYWKPVGEEIPVHDLEGNIKAFKRLFVYFNLGREGKWRKTHWTMEEYRLSFSYVDNINSQVDDWILGRIRRGKDYYGHL